MSRVLRLTIGVLAFAFFMEANPVSYLHRGSWTSTAEAIVGRRRGAGGVGADRMIGSLFPVRRGPCGSIICAMSNGATR